MHGRVMGVFAILPRSKTYCFLLLNVLKSMRFPIIVTDLFYLYENP